MESDALLSPADGFVKQQAATALVVTVVVIVTIMVVAATTAAIPAAAATPIRGVIITPTTPAAAVERWGHSWVFAVAVVVIQHQTPGLYTVLQGGRESQGRPPHVAYLRCCNKQCEYCVDRRSIEGYE